jgi:hypothetical protein
VATRYVSMPAPRGRRTCQGDFKAREQTLPKNTPPRRIPLHIQRHSTSSGNRDDHSLLAAGLCSAGSCHLRHLEQRTGSRIELATRQTAGKDSRRLPQSSYFSYSEDSPNSSHTSGTVALSTVNLPLGEADPKVTLILVSAEISFSMHTQG